MKVLVLIGPFAPFVLTGSRKFTVVSHGHQSWPGTGRWCCWWVLYVKLHRYNNSYDSAFSYTVYKWYRCMFAADVCFDEWQHFNRSHIFSVFDRHSGCTWKTVHCCGLTLSLQPTDVFMITLFRFFHFFPLWWACQRTKQNSALFHLHCWQSEFISSHHRNRSVSCFCYINKCRKVSINGSC